MSLIELIIIGVVAAITSIFLTVLFYACRLITQSRSKAYKNIKRMLKPYETASFDYNNQIVIRDERNNKTCFIHADICATDSFSDGVLEILDDWRNEKEGE